jgi:CRAL/TRIO domain
MDKVFDTFEKALIFVRNHHSWFDWTGENLRRILELYDTGFLKVMKERDDKGRRILILNNKLDISKFKADDVFRLHCLVILIIALEEETQICGAVFIDDFTFGATMKYLSIYPLKSLYDFTYQLKVAPIRLQNILVVGLPAFAVQFTNIVRLALTETMNERFKALESLTELDKFVDKSLLTKDYRGPRDILETVEDFREIINQKLEVVKKFFDFEIDMTKAEMMKGMSEACGSFRKLEID